MQNKYRGFSTAGSFDSRLHINLHTFFTMTMIPYWFASVNLDRNAEQQSAKEPQIHQITALSLLYYLTHISGAAALLARYIIETESCAGFLLNQRKLTRASVKLFCCRVIPGNCDGNFSKRKKEQNRERSLLFLYTPRLMTWISDDHLIGLATEYFVVAKPKQVILSHRFTSC